MGDNIKLIVEIPKELYANKKGYLTNMDAYIICKAVQNGTPLKDVKAEIEHMIPCDKEALSMKLGVLEILDNIGKESEVKNNEET